MQREQSTDEFFSKAQEHIRKIGYDTKWVHEVSPDCIAVQEFFVEYIWVVYACNFKVAYLERLWDPLRQAYGSYETLDMSRMQTVLNIINNKAKWKAVYRTAIKMQFLGWDEFKKAYLNSIDSLTWLDFIGPVTKFHLARNLGFDVAKPDRWMCRMAEKLGWENVASMCDYLAKKHGLKVKEVDIILWKYSSDLGLGGTGCTKRRNVT